MEQYFQFTGMTAEKMMEEMKPQAVKTYQDTDWFWKQSQKQRTSRSADEKLDEELAEDGRSLQDGS